MNVLEKISQEIEERIKKLKEADNICRVNAERNRNFESVKYFQSLMFATERAKSIIGDIIRSHMDEAKDINVPSNDGWIDRKTLKEEIKSLRFTINGMRNGKTMTNLALEEYRKSILKIIDEQPTYMDDGWISVEERLPNEREFQEAYCRNHYAAEFLVTIEGATKPTTLYFKNNRWFDEERNYYKVIAWQPLPERYKGGDDRA